MVQIPYMLGEQGYAGGGFFTSLYAGGQVSSVPASPTEKEKFKPQNKLLRKIQKVFWNFDALLSNRTRKLIPNEKNMYWGEERSPLYLRDRRLWFEG
jgi:hypothetical protein